MSINDYEAAILLEAFARDARFGPDAIALDGDPLTWPLEERPVIYVAGYYSACPTQGVANAVEAYEKLLAVGWIPLVPHVSMLIDMLAPNTPEMWYGYDKALLARCDFMYVCPDYLTAHSGGVLNEIEFATKHGIPILYDVVAAKDRYAV